MTYTPGTQVGKYEIRHKLGQGAMGEVHVAYDAILEREVAIKVMATSVLEASDLKTRFESEAKAVARLQHPNIVTVYDFGYDEAQAAYIVMELLKGRDLEKSLRSDPPAVPESLRIVLQICRGLTHAHDNGIVHRDIKPANIFVTDDGLVKIMDFGVARWAQAAQTKTGTVVGTAAYMSPEQLQGQTVDGRSDLFSLGVILHQLLTHQQPFLGDDIRQIFYKILNTQPPHLVLDGERIPELQRILERSLSKNANERYRTAREMAEDISDLIDDTGGTLSGQTVLSTVPPTTEAFPYLGAGTESKPDAAAGGDEKVQPRRAWRTVLVAAAVAVLASGLYLFGRFARGDHQPNTQPAPSVSDSSPIPATDPGADREVSEARALEETGAGSGSTRGSSPTEPGTGQPITTKQERQIASPTVTPPAEASPGETPPETPRIAAQPPPRVETPAPAARAMHKAETARGALARGALQEAGFAISQGRQIDPSLPAWEDLEGQLQRAQKARDERRAATERANRYLAEALEHLETDEYDAAIADFRKALIYDPENTQASNGLRQVESLQRQQEPAKNAPRRRFDESPTELVKQTQRSRLEGFSADDTVKVEAGSADLSVPGEVLIELNPRDARSAEPYTLTVRLHNEANTALLAKSLELVTSYGGKKLGAGVEIPLSLRRVNPQSTVLLHEVSGKWKEEQNAGGSITAIVTLGTGKLRKVLTWSPGT